MREGLSRLGRVAIAATGVLALVVTIGAQPVLARPSKAARCSATKTGASGRLLGALLGCHAKARTKAKAVSTACLDKASGRFDSRFDDASCSGDREVVRSLVDACVVILTGDVTGTGKCAGIGLSALGAAARALGGCGARDALHPGKGTACMARVFGRLDSKLAMASGCTAASARDDLVADCWRAILDALAGKTTTTTTATTTSLPLPTTTTSTTTTSAPPSTGQTFPTTTSTSTTVTTIADTTTTESTTTQTTTTDTTTTETTTTETTTTETSSTEMESTTTTSTTDTTTTTVECVSPATCPGQDDECQTRTCDTGKCGVSFTPGDTVVTDQVPGNCRDTICDGAGGFAEGIDDNDLPVDGNDCTLDLCSNGVPAHPPTGEGGQCDDDGGILCDGFGKCVECLIPEDCPGSDTECATRTCASNACGVDPTPAGTPLSIQVLGDCHEDQCDGSGGVENVIDDTDSNDLNECTTDSCLQGTPTHTPLPDTTPCSNGECNQGFCCAIGQVCG